MQMALRFSRFFAALTVLCFAAQGAPLEPGFVRLFDGHSLHGWKLVGKRGGGYGVRDGLLYCAQGGGGNLLTQKEYANFIFRFEFQLRPGSNNGVAIRAPMAAGSLAYLGMEIQILDNTAPKYAHLLPAQYHGSIYKIVPAKRGALKPVGEWNQEEILADGRHIRVTLNGQVIVDADLNQVHDPHILRQHPGMLRPRGHIGFLGHHDYVAFRNIRIKELPYSANDNAAPEGFRALFNGIDLTGWKGLVASPPRRARMTARELAAAQKKADARMRAHWKAEHGVLVFDGKGDNLCTAKNFGDFELLVDWKIPPKGDSGIYLRGSPQVQIWDRDIGSGGLFNNQKNPNKPLVRADHPPGQWNRFRILMVGDRVHVFLNGQLVVDDVKMENYWERNKPIYSTGSIELQNHMHKLWFKSIYVREIPRSSASQL